MGKLVKSKIADIQLHARPPIVASSNNQLIDIEVSIIETELILCCPRDSLGVVWIHSAEDTTAKAGNGVPLYPGDSITFDVSENGLQGRDFCKATLTDSGATILNVSTVRRYQII